MFLCDYNIIVINRLVYRRSGPHTKIISTETRATVVSTRLTIRFTRTKSWEENKNDNKSTFCLFCFHAEIVRSIIFYPDPLDGLFVSQNLTSDCRSVSKSWFPQSPHPHATYSMSLSVERALLPHGLCNNVSVYLFFLNNARHDAFRIKCFSRYFGLETYTDQSVRA